jgi:hypothetical protein
MAVLDAPLGEGLEVGNGFSKDESVDILDNITSGQAERACPWNSRMFPRRC